MRIAALMPSNIRQLQRTILERMRQSQLSIVIRQLRLTSLHPTFSMPHKIGACTLNWLLTHTFQNGTNWMFDVRLLTSAQIYGKGIFF